MSIRTTHTGGQITREVCVGAGSPLLVNEEIDFVYSRAASYGRAALLLTTASLPTVTATAMPASIDAGDSVQLVANVTGSIPPYFYAWVPFSTLDDNDIAAPIATPTVTTTYTVGITDSSGRHATSSVTIFVRPELTVTAAPSVIDAGDPVQLEAQALGGTPPYTYSWAPVETLDDPNSADPIARPTATTTYVVTWTDETDAVLTGTATVTVRGAPTPTPTSTPTPTPTPEPTPTPTPMTASFVFNVTCCPYSINLDASTSTGPIVSYTWDVSWTSANPDRVTSIPTTSILFNETDRGTIRLTVTDAAGNTATATRNFPF